MTTATFNIAGIHCASCSARNERMLQETRWASRDASVNFATHGARVEFDDAIVRPWEDALRHDRRERLPGAQGGIRRRDHGASAARASIGKAAGIPRARCLHLPPPLLGDAGYRAAVDAARAQREHLDSRRSSSAVVIRHLRAGNFTSACCAKPAIWPPTWIPSISLGTLAALLFSVWGMFAGEHHLYFETGAVIAALILLGRYFEAREVAARPAMRPRCARSVPRRQDGASSTGTARNKTFPSMTSGSATCSWSSPARKFRWTAKSSMAAPTSTSRC